MARTLSALRRDAADDQRIDEALAPYPKAPKARGPQSRYVPAEYQATTLDQLRARCGVYGAAAVEEAVHSALSTWLMRREASTASEIKALSQHWRDQRVRLRIPVLSGKPPPSLYERRPDGEREATRATVLALMTEWQGLGCPGLIKAIQHTHQVINSAIVSEQQRELARQAIGKFLEGGPHGGPNE